MGSLSNTLGPIASAMSPAISGMFGQGVGENLSKIFGGNTPGVMDESGATEGGMLKNPILDLGPFGGLATGGLGPNGLFGGNNPMSGLGLLGRLLNPGDPQTAGPGGFAGPQGGFPADSQIPGMEGSSVPGVDGYAEGEHPPVEVAAKDPWKPRKPTILGAIADAYLEANGYGPAFSENRNARSYREAMEGYDQNPERALSRIRQIPGMEKEAWNMTNTYEDNVRQRGTLDRQNSVFDMQREKIVFERIAGMMNTATPETWAKMRELAITVGNRYGQDVSMYIPEEYDPDSIGFIAGATIKPRDQERLEDADARIAQGDKRIQQGDRRLNETNRHNLQTEGQAAVNEQGRMARDASPAPVAKPRSVMTKYGPGIINKDGTMMTVFRNGKTYGYIKAGEKDGQINWVPQGEIELK